MQFYTTICAVLKALAYHFYHFSFSALSKWVCPLPKSMISYRQCKFPLQWTIVFPEVYFLSKSLFCIDFICDFACCSCWANIKKHKESQQLLSGVHVLFTATHFSCSKTVFSEIDNCLCGQYTNPSWRKYSHTNEKKYVSEIQT